MEYSSELQKTTTQGIKFLMVGVSGIGVNFTVLTIAHYVFHLEDAIAFALAILCSMTSNYTLNRIWTFDSSKKIRSEYPKYILLNFVGVAIQYSVALGLQTYFKEIGFDGIYLGNFLLASLYFASMTGIGLGFISNFLFSKYIVFKDEEE